MKRTSELRLSYPLYLDVPMMIGFLASMEDGISYQADHRSTTRRKTGVAGEASAGTSKAPWFSVIPISVQGKLDADAESEITDESQILLRHTEASMFNRLRNRLMDEGLILEVPNVLSERTAEFKVGSMVEMSGHANLNPLDRVVSTLDQLFGVVRSIQDEQASVGTKSPLKGNRNKSIAGQESGAPPELPPAGRALLNLLRAEEQASGISELVLRSTDGSRPTAVLTMLQEFLEGRIMSRIIDSEVTVLGKVSRIIESGELNLNRRSLLASMPNAQSEQMFDGMSKGLSFNIDSNSLKTSVEAPLIQILPLAVFI